MARLNFLWRVTDAEYRANLNGMNTFFGAVLGFVLSDVETDRLIEFAQLLLVTTGIVIGILYLSASRQRWWYAALNLLLIWLLPGLVAGAEGSTGRLQVTLAIWTLLSIFLELVKGRDTPAA